MLDNCKVSVIVPVYNTEEYLRQCIESILCQTFEDYELILIDDGSTDGSGKICDEYQRADGRIITIHQENQGLVRSRQIGVEHATAEYIMFVDSDDWIDRDMLAELYHKAITYECDIVLSGVWNGNHEEETDWPQEGCYDVQDKNCKIYHRLFVEEQNYRVKGLRPNLCSRLFKKDNLSKNILLVDSKIKNGEDDACFYPCILSAHKIYVMKRTFYHYRVRDDAMHRKASEFDIYQTYALGKRLIECVMEHPQKDVLMGQVQRYVYLRTNKDISRMANSIIEPFYLFPYNTVDRGSRIVIYGAGAVGRSWMKQLVQLKYCFVVGWIDRYVHNETVRPIEDLRNLEYDTILLATESEEIALDMKSALSEYGISEGKIYWDKLPDIGLTYSVKD